MEIVLLFILVVSVDASMAVWGKEGKMPFSVYTDAPNWVSAKEGVADVMVRLYPVKFCSLLLT